MFDGVPIVKMVDINHNWIWCPNSKHGTARCKMAIRNEHQIPPKPKLTMQQMYGHKRVYQAGQVPDKSVDVAKHITWTAKIVRGKYDEEVKARQNASSSAATTNQEVN